MAISVARESGKRGVGRGGWGRGRKKSGLVRRRKEGEESDIHKRLSGGGVRRENETKKEKYIFLGKRGEKKEKVSSEARERGKQSETKARGKREDSEKETKNI